MKRLSKEERRAALKERTTNNVVNSGGGDFGARYLSTEGFEDVKWYKPSAKTKNLVDIIPYIISTKNHPQGMRPGYEDYILDLHVHKNIGPRNDSFICLTNTFNKPCPICEEADRLRSAGKEEEAKALKPKRRAIYNVIDLKNPDDGIQIFDTVHYFFEKELTDELKASFEGEIPVFSDIEEGMSVEFRASEKTFNGRKFFEYKSFNFVDREEQYQEPILDEVYPLDKMMVIPTYDEVSASFYGVMKEEESDDGDIPEEKPTRARRTYQKEEVEEEEAPKEETSRRRRRETTEAPKSKCPYGHTFGDDNLEFTDCDACEVDHSGLFAECETLYMEKNPE